MMGVIIPMERIRKRMEKKEYIEREAVMQKFADHVRRSNNSDFAPVPTWNQAVQIVEDFPAADVPPLPLWTDEPISGTEFMTHNQGQSGFEIHFRTDDKAKYKAVQDECRRQIGHAKPAADVVPVGAYNQAAWERDTAIEQLKQIGKSFGEKMDDVRPVVLCRDCKHNMANIPDIQDGMNINENWNACQLTELYDSVKPDDFCSHGVKREET